MEQKRLPNGFTVIELYSGLGGMHQALKISEIPFKLVAAYEINTIANDVYGHTFPDTTLLQRNIKSITSEEMDSLDADLWTMSPPCQPFTRLGKQKDVDDNRSDSFQHLLTILPKMRKPPRYILMENVKGFETSESHRNFIETLKKTNYCVQQFLLTPKQFGVPNSRLRYYALARLRDSDLDASFSGDISGEKICEVLPTYTLTQHTNSLSHYLEAEENRFQNYLLPDNILLKFSSIFDVVFPDSLNSCCFTKGYSHYVHGTGSILMCGGDKCKLDSVYKNLNQEKTDEERIVLLKSLELRWFTPREVASLMGFPSTFKFPINITEKQQYRLLGNSINVLVVSRLLKFLLLNET